MGARIARSHSGAIGVDEVKKFLEDFQMGGRGLGDESLTAFNQSGMYVRGGNRGLAGISEKFDKYR